MMESLDLDSFIIGTYQVIGKVNDIIKYGEWFAIEQLQELGRVLKRMKSGRGIAKVIGAYLVPHRI
jgi:hypothetical protein